MHGAGEYRTYETVCCAVYVCFLLLSLFPCAPRAPKPAKTINKNYQQQETSNKEGATTERGW